jgi:hypothetical protein
MGSFEIIRGWEKFQGLPICYTILKMSSLRLLLCVLLLLLPGSVRAEPNPKLFFRPNYSPDSPRQFIVPPLASLLLPGTDQWLEGQFGHATFYSTFGIGGLTLRIFADENVDNRYKDLGTQIYFTAGALSLYHSFRTAVYTRRPYKEFDFLQIDERPTDLLFSPFHSRYLERLTTWIPLLTAAGIFFLVDFEPTGGDGGSVSFSDLSYASGIGLTTGVAEEAVFRGWVLPVAMHYTQSKPGAILISSAAFSLAHGLRFRHFVTSMLFGLYAGWLTQHNDWAIGEAIFIHSWWDVMAFLADYANHREHAVLRLPVLHLQF